jgi:hypothetical protein
VTKIIVKNGDWDKARAELKSCLDEQDARFNAQIAAVLGPHPSVRKAAAPAEPNAPGKQGAAARPAKSERIILARRPRI